MQIVYIDLIPQKEKPIVNLSQYDNDRVVRFMLLENGEEYTLTGTETIDVNIKKPDGNIVVITPTVTANHYVDVLFTEQAAACYGQSVGELSIKENSTIIGTCNFILDVEKSPTCGGIESDSAIANLKTQVDAITMEYLINNTDEIAEIIANKIYPTLEASGDIATFNTILQLPLVSVTADPLATEITRCGKNLAPFFRESVKTQNGITVTPQPDGSMHLTGRSTSPTNFLISINDYIKNLPAGIYTYSNGNFAQNYVYSQIVASGHVLYSYQAKDTYNYSSGLSISRLDIGITGSAYNVDIDVTIYPQLEIGSMATTYETFKGITKPIAEATTITTLTGENNVFTDNGPVTVEYKYFPDI